MTELEKFVEVLPNLVKQVKQGKYSSELLTKMILKKLTGDTLQVLKCTACEEKFTVDKPSKLGSYHCPYCISSYQVPWKPMVNVRAKG